MAVSVGTQEVGHGPSAQSVDSEDSLGDQITRYRQVSAISYRFSQVYPRRNLSLNSFIGHTSKRQENMGWQSHPEIEIICYILNFKINYYFSAEYIFALPSQNTSCVNSRNQKTPNKHNKLESTLTY